MESVRFFLHLLGPPVVEALEGGEAEGEGGSVRRVDIPRGKPLALLVYVALAATPPSREELATLLWPSSPRRRARGSLRQAIWQLRQSLEDDLFTVDDPLTLAPGRLTTDVHRMRKHIAGGRLTEALALWRGSPLRDLHVAGAPRWERWSERIRQELEAELAGALSSRGHRERHTGAGEEALRWLEKARDIQPYLLRHHVALAQAHLELRAFDRAGAVLGAARQQFEDPESDHPESLPGIAELEERLDALKQGSRGKPASASIPSDPSLRLRFTGRTEEFSTLVRTWRRACEGETSLALILGEAGIGKTRLAEEIALLARSERGRVVRVKAEDTERPIEWGLLGEMVDHLLRLSGAAGISPGSTDVLRTVVPSLPGSEFASRPDGGGGLPLQIPRTRPSAALSDALQDLLAAVAEDDPLLVLVDDLQWADAESRAILARVCTRMKGSPILFIVTSRSSVAEVSPRTRKTLGLLSGAAGAGSLELAPLSQGEIRELLDRTLVAPEQAATNRVMDRLVRTSRGNPLFIVELLKVLQVQGILTESDEGRWRLHLDRVPDDLPLPASLRELIDRQLANLPEEASLVAAHLARASHPLSARVLATRAGLGPERFTAGVAELVQRRMIQWEPGEKLVFAHDELRAAVGRRFQLHVGLTTGGGTQWSLFRSAVVASLVLLIASAAAYAFRGGTLPLAPPLGGGALLVIHGPDSVLEARAPITSPTAGWRIEPVSTATLEAWAADVAASNADVGASSAGTGSGSLLRLASVAGARILDVTNAGNGSDSARVLRPDGSMVDARGWDRILGASWCGGTPPALLLTVQNGARVELLRWDPEAGTATALEAPGFPGTVTACSPDGRYGAVLTALDGETGIHLVDLVNGTTFRLPVPGARGVQALHWQADAPTPIPTSVELAGDPQRDLAWGEREQLDARVLYSDGSRARRGIVWTSRNPGIASVTAGGFLTANRPGTTVIDATFDGWLHDSLSLEVRETDRVPRVLLWDAVPPLGDDVWRSTTRSMLRGDRSIGGWTAADGTGGLPQNRSVRPSSPGIWRSVDGFAMPEGGMLEMEFLLRGGGAPLRACLALEAAGQDLFGAEDGEPSREPDARLCLTLRSMTGEPEDADLDFHSAFPAIRVPILPSEPAERPQWRHVGLGFLPDGTGVAFIDGQEVARTPMRLPLSSSGHWHVVLEGMEPKVEGETVDRTFRNVLLWPEVRF